MVQILMVNFNSNMATKLDDYVCMQMCWPVAMNPVEKLTAEMLNYSMFADYSSTDDCL